MSLLLYWTFLLLMLCCLLPNKLKALPASTPPPGVVRRGVRAPLTTITARQYLPAVDMDQHAEPSSMIGELARVGVRRRNYQNRILEDSLSVNNNNNNNEGRKQITKVLEVDDSIFGSRQLPKSRSIGLNYQSQNINLRPSHSDKYRTDRKNYFSARNNDDEQLVKDKQKDILDDADLLGDVDEQQLKNELLDRIQNFQKKIKNKEIIKTKQEDVLFESKNNSKETEQQNIIALGESRSYSYSTNTQPTTSVRQTVVEDGNHLLSSYPSLRYETKQTQDNTDMYTTVNPASVFRNQEKTDRTTFRTTVRFDDSQEAITNSPDLEKVISVRVSSSVVSSLSNRLHHQTQQQPVQFKTDPTETNTLPFTTTSSLTLLTEDQPQVTAVQRSSFSVEEPAGGDNFNPQISPVSYQSSVSSATSGSSVRFYSDPPSYHRRVITQPQPAIVQEDKPTAIELEPTTKKEIPELTTGTFPNDPQYKHETRVETVSYHEEVVPSVQSDNFGKRVNDVKTTSTDPSPTQETDRRSYQFTNVHDQSYHHVQVTHHRPDPVDGKEPEKRQRTNQDGRYFRYEGTTEKNYGVPEQVYGKPEQNYEVDESVSLMTDGRAHGVQKQHSSTESSTDIKKKDNNKFGYVVEGRNFRKYRVEERTADGFIVGEYGVVSNDDGSLRGVRYTADGTINPRLIYDALLKFLSL